MFQNNSAQVISSLHDICVEWLYEIAEEVEAQTKRNCDNGAVDTGQLRGSYTYEIDEYNLSGKVGSPLENAVWSEFGTGNYAQYGNGRKTPWYVPVAGYTGKKRPTYNGKVVVVHTKNGDFYKTNGKRPHRMMQRAYDSVKNKAQKALEKKLKRLEK